MAAATSNLLPMSDTQRDHVTRAALALIAATTLAAASPARIPPPAPRFVPIYAANFPDPFTMPYRDYFLAYATNAEGRQANVQMAVSDDLRAWAPLKTGGKPHDAMPDLPAWAEPGWT
jgi:hypothetical protein